VLKPRPDPTDLHLLVTTLDSAEEAAGWGAGAQMVGVEGHTLAFVAFPGHPYDSLLGVAVPATWQAMGVICEGWAAKLEDADFVRNTTSQRPSRTFGRQRVRIVAVVNRAGDQVSGTRTQGDEFKVIDEPMVGRISDAMLRAMGCATPPPGFPVVEYFAQGWLANIVTSGKRGKHAAKAPVEPLRVDDELLALGFAEGWDTLRRLVANGRAESSVSADVAAWMDAGIFARSLIGDLPPLDTLAKQARRRVDAAGRAQIDACLARLGGDRAA
jgi:hypothetical protein